MSNEVRNLESEMFHAIIGHSTASVEGLLQQEPMLVHGRYLSNASFLHLAVKEGDIRIVDLLLRSGADVNKPSDPPLYCPPLCDAAEYGRLDIVRLLMHHGAFVDGVDCTCITPLMLAAREANLEVLKELLEAGAEVNRLGYIQRYFAVDFAGWHRSEAAVAMLREYGGISVSDDFDWEAQRGYPIISHVSNDGGPVYPIAYTRPVNGTPFDFRLATMRIKDTPLFLFTAGLYSYGSVEVAFALPSKWPLKQAYLRPRSKCSFPIDILEIVANKIASGSKFIEGSTVTPGDAGCNRLEWPSDVKFLVAVNHSWRSKPLKSSAESETVFEGDNGDEPAGELRSSDLVQILTLVVVRNSERLEPSKTFDLKILKKKRLASWAKIVPPLPC